ncbi:MAG: NAD-dependent epimerase/dehydratase family protein [Planctomycetota bacterium]
MVDSREHSMKGRRCLVTGGAGFIGSHLVDALVDSGASVRVLDDFSSGDPSNLEHHELNPSFEVLRGDAADPEVAEEAVQGCDTIFHLAAMVSVPRSLREPAKCHAQCATSTVHLLSAADRADVRRFVLASTSAIYGDSPFVSKRESDPTAPLTPYAASKLSAESYLRSFAKTSRLETVALRFFNVFGPRQDPRSEYSAVIPRFVSMILSGESPIIYGDGMQSRDFVFVRDVAQANLLAANTPNISGRVFNVARGSSTTLLELLSLLRELLDRDIVPIHEPARLGDVRDSLADINEIRTHLGFEPSTSIRDGLEESVAYYKRLCAVTPTT